MMVDEHDDQTHQYQWSSYIFYGHEIWLMVRPYPGHQSLRTSRHGAARWVGGAGDFAKIFVGGFRCLSVL